MQLLNFLITVTAIPLLVAVQANDVAMYPLCDRPTHGYGKPVCNQSLATRYCRYTSLTDLNIG